MPKLDRRPPIIALAQNEWDGPWMNRQELLSRLAGRGWAVVYSNGALTVWNRAGRRWHNAKLTGRVRCVDGVLVDEPGRLLVRWPGRTLWDKPMLTVHARRLRKAVNATRGDPLILQVFSPNFLDYVRALDPTRLAFHIHDFYPGFPGWSSEKQRRLDELAERADLITLAGPDMVSCLPRSARHRARPLYNAGNPERYIEANSEPCPADLASIDHPRIGYVGNINGKCDFDLVLRLALMRPDWQWVFVGDVALGRSSDRAKWDACLECDNVHWLGMKDRFDVPRYVTNMDVNALLFRTHGENVGWVQYTNPLRVNGALASGKPIIGADIRTFRRLRPLVEVAAGAEEWAAALERAFHSPNDEARRQRQERSRQSSWDTRAVQLEKWFFEMVDGVAPTFAGSGTESLHQRRQAESS